MQKPAGKKSAGKKSAKSAPGFTGWNPNVQMSAYPHVLMVRHTLVPLPTGGGVGSFPQQVQIYEGDMDTVLGWVGSQANTAVLGRFTNIHRQPHGRQRVRAADETYTYLIGFKDPADYENLSGRGTANVSDPNVTRINKTLHGRLPGSQAPYSVHSDPWIWLQ